MPPVTKGSRDPTICPQTREYKAPLWPASPHCLAASPTVHSSSSVLHLPPSVKMAQQIRQNYHEECEALVNKQINMELYASYVYIAIANYFTQTDQALPGFAHFFRKSSDTEHSHGLMMMEYQAKRGGKVVLQDITKPTRMEWGTPLEAMTAVLEMEKTVRVEEDYVIDLHCKIP